MVHCWSDRKWPVPNAARVGVPQADDQVEDRGSRLRVDGVGDEVPVAHELESLAGLRVGQSRFEKTSAKDLRRLRIEGVLERLALRRVLGEAVVSPAARTAAGQAGSFVLPFKTKRAVALFKV